MLKVIMLRKKQDQLEKREAELCSKLAGYKQREDELQQKQRSADRQRPRPHRKTEDGTKDSK